MTVVVIDSSSWIDFFRGEREAVRRIDLLLEDGRAAICGPIHSEVVSGAPNRILFDRLDQLLGALPSVGPPEEIWGRVAQARFALARVGVQANVVDLYIALSTSAASAILLSRDRDFRSIKRVVDLDLELF